MSYPNRNYNSPNSQYSNKRTSENHHHNQSNHYNHNSNPNNYSQHYSPAPSWPGTQPRNNYGSPAPPPPIHKTDPNLLPPRPLSPISKRNDDLEKQCQKLTEDRKAAEKKIENLDSEIQDYQFHLSMANHSHDFIKKQVSDIQRQIETLERTGVL